MEEDLGGLRHAWFIGLYLLALEEGGGREREHGEREERVTGNCFGGKVAKTGNCPGVLVGFHETAAIVSIVDYVKKELGVCLDRVDTGFEEESGGLVK